MLRLRDLREDNDLTQETVAKLINCTQATYSKYELGKRSIPINSLIVLARHYNTSIDYIVGLTKVEKAYPRNKR